jgi:hypothetical protein
MGRPEESERKPEAVSDMSDVLNANTVKETQQHSSFLTLNILVDSLSIEGYLYYKICTSF